MYVFTYIHTQGQKTHQRVAHIAVHAFMDSTYITYVTHVLTVYAQISQNFAAISQMPLVGGF